MLRGAMSGRLGGGGGGMFARRPMMGNAQPPPINRFRSGFRSGSGIRPFGGRGWQPNGGTTPLDLLALLSGGGAAPMPAGPGLQPVDTESVLAGVMSPMYGGVEPTPPAQGPSDWYQGDAGVRPPAADSGRPDAALWNPQLPGWTNPFGMASGGVVPGPSQPADQVPIMATGGEMVVPQDMTQAVAQSNSPDPLIQALQGIIAQGPQGPGSHLFWGGLLGRRIGHHGRRNHGGYRGLVRG